MDEKNQNGKVVFDSADISKKENPDYFAGRVKEEKAKKILKELFDGKRKFVVLGVLLFIVALIVVLVLWLTVWSKPSENVQENNASDMWSQELSDINSQAYSILSDPGAEAAYPDAVRLYDEKIETIDNEDHKFDVEISRAEFMSFNGGKGGAEAAITSLLDIDEGSLTDAQKYKLYLSLRSAYQKLDNDSYVQIYTEKIDELPKNITTQGDEADE